MFVFLCFAFFAAVQASPVGKIIPVFEDAYHLRHHADPRIAHSGLCFDDCHHHSLNKPVFIVRSAPGGQSIHYAPLGLNGLAKSPLTAPLQDALLSAEPIVLAIFPFARFPFELFPGLLDADLVIPEHIAKLSHMYKEAPVVAIFPQEEFRKINERLGLIQVADFSTDSNGFAVAKDFALYNRNVALGPSPLAINRDVTPAGQAVHPTFITPARTAVFPIHGVPHSEIRIVDDSKKFIPYTHGGTGYYTIPVY